MNGFGQRRTSECGGILVELALILPFLMSLCLAVLDLGLGFRADLNLANAVRAGVRVGAAQGTASGADHAILVSIGSGLGRINPSQVTAIVVFRAATAAGTVPPNCLTPATRAAGGSSSDACNVYGTADLAGVLASPTVTPTTFTGTCPGSRRDRFWCPTGRDNTAGINGVGLDYLGVYLEVDHQTVTKLFGSTLHLDDTAVMRIEPDAGK